VSVPERQTDAVLGHLGVNVPDLERAKSYYGEVMPLLGFETDVCLTQRHGPAANQSTSWDPGGCW
jgi:catechol-2,3-dioxygenase